MRKTLATAALLLAFTCPALAGEMHTPGSPEPPPASATQEPAGGEMGTPGAALNGEMATPGVSDGLTQVALELLAALL